MAVQMCEGLAAAHAAVSPDGGSILYPAFSTKTGLWMLEGFEKP